jgi:hypothetical protein
VNEKDERLLTFDVTEPGIASGETGGRAAFKVFKAQAAPKAKLSLSPEHMEVGPTKFGGRFLRNTIAQGLQTRS